MNNKVLHIVIFDGSFETTAFIRRLIKGMLKNDIQISVLGFNEQLPNKIDGVNYIKLGSNQSKWGFIKTCVCANPFSISTYLNVLKGNRKALQQKNLQIAIKKSNPSIIHVQWPSLLPWLETVLKEKTIPIVLSERGSQVLVKAKTDPDFRQALLQYYPQLSGIHAVSKHIKQTSKKIFQHNVATQVIYSGVNITDWPFTEVKSKPYQDPVRFLSVGRPHYIKGYAYALQALAQLKEQGINFTYTLVGGTNEEFTYLVQQYQLTAQVTILGKLSISQVKAYYTQSDVLLLPSVSEGVANVAIEAMAVGLPVISANVGGMPELITHRATGFLFESRNPLSLKKVIETFLSLSPQQIKLLIESARLKIAHTFTEEKMVLDMVQFYRSVLTKTV